jgi:hypothetical protein
MVHGLHDFDGGQSITLAIGWKGWALEISNFLGPHGIHFACCHFRAQKCLDFQGPLLQMALKMDLPVLKSLSPASYQQKVHASSLPRPPLRSRRA